VPPCLREKTGARSAPPSQFTHTIS
jgi:hypothetical protein